MKQSKKTSAAHRTQQCRMRMATEQAAAHAASVAIARWSRDYRTVETMVPPCPRVSWHAAVQHDFMCWLAAGGFAQPDQCASAAETCQATAEITP